MINHFLQMTSGLQRNRHSYHVRALCACLECVCVCVYNSICKCVSMACAAGGLGGIGMGLGPGGQPINANRLSGGGVGSMGPGGVFTFA